MDFITLQKILVFLGEKLSNQISKHADHLLILNFVVTYKIIQFYDNLCKIIFFYNGDSLVKNILKYIILKRYKNKNFK